MLTYFETDELNSCHVMSCLPSVLPVTTCVSYSLLRYFHMNEKYVNNSFLFFFTNTKQISNSFSKQSVAFLSNKFISIRLYGNKFVISIIL